MAPENKATRLERDSLGELQIPADAYYGIQTWRAMHNFPVSGQPLPASFIEALVLLKKAAAVTNQELGLLDHERAQAIINAADEILAGKFSHEFPIDIYQTGSGTSTNMNVNEVIASRANESLGGQRGDHAPVHPNDHVNLGQSSNDLIPTSLHVALLTQIQRHLRPALTTLESSLRRQSEATWPIIKTGRTHLQDATPIRLGQEFLGWAGQIERAQKRLGYAENELSEVAIGGTAVGTGINAHRQYPARVCELVNQWLGLHIHETSNHFQAQPSSVLCA